MAIKPKFAGAIVGAFLFLPSFALGAYTNSPERAAAPAGLRNATETTKDFCTNLPTLSAQITERIAKSQGSLSNRQQQRNTNVGERKNKHAQQLADLRLKGDQERVAIYAKLMAKAATDGQKQAVTEFQTTIEAAVSARRGAVDASVTAYWSGVDAVLSARQPAVQTAGQTFSSTIQTALSAASTECASGVAAATVRQHFNASLVAAKNKFVADRKGIDKAVPQLEALAKTRNDAVKKAMADFRAIAEQARKDLKAALAVK